jgi:hypothetical protein
MRVPWVSGVYDAARRPGRSGRPTRFRELVNSETETSLRTAFTYDYI